MTVAYPSYFGSKAIKPEATAEEKKAFSFCKASPSGSGIFGHDKGSRP